MQRGNTPSVGDFLPKPGMPTIPFSTLMRFGTEANIWIWTSALANMQLITALKNTTAQDDLKPLPGEPAQHFPQFFALHSQFRLFAQVTNETTQEIKSTLAYTQDLEALEKCPIILASHLVRPKEETSFTTDRIYPPVEHGTIGLVMPTTGWDNIHEWRYYSISDLPKEAQERQARIRQRLEELERHSVHMARLGPSVTPFFNNDMEVKVMIQQLAQDYYQYHQSLAHIPPPRSVFGNGKSQIPSCLPFLATMASIHDAASKATKWVQTEDHAPFFHYEKPSGSSIIEYKTGRKDEVFNSKTTASLWSKVQQLSDSSNDVLLDLFAHFIRPSETDGTTWFFASQYLDDRGLKKITKGENAAQRRTAGHRQEDIAEVGHHLDLLENIWITIDQTIDESSDGKKKRKKRRFTHQGRLFMIEERITQKDLHGDNSSDLEIAWRVRPGNWLRPFLEDPNRQVANLFQKSLQYDPYRQQWEKRLSRYFMLFGHMETRGGGGTFNRYIKKLLQEVSLSVETANPKRTKERFERAMDQLVTDSIIHEWHYQDSVDVSKRGWVTDWLDLMVTIYIAPTRQLI